MRMVATKGATVINVRKMASLILDFKLHLLNQS